MAQIIDGKLVAQEVRTRAAELVGRVREAGVEPGLAVVLVGEDPASQSYVRMKERDCAEVGIRSVDLRRPADISQAELEEIIDRCNADPAIHGILVQLPLPAGLDEEAALARISSEKDVDGLHPINLGYLAQGRPVFIPCTPKGCMRLLREVDCDPTGLRAVVLGRSVLVGKPIALLLQNANATVTVCHSKTRELADEVRRADIVVAAIGRPEMVQGDWIKEGAVVLDVGINRTAEGKLVGDVQFTSAIQRARAITPVPRGVGPMTIACLLENTVEAARRRRG